MRYELDENGYILAVFWGCHSGKCQEYTGTVPSGYSNLIEWSEKAIINAYYIVDGNLTLDSNRSYKLQLIQKQEAEENAHVTKKEMGIASTDEMNPYTDLYPSQQSAGGYITSLDGTYNKVGNLPTEEVNLSLLEKQNLDLIELEFIGNNFLPNTAVNSINNGIKYSRNTDKTINISGTATDRSTLNLAGTDTSVRNILTFKGNEKYVDDTGERIEVPNNYLLFGLEGLSLEFYNYDGTDRTLVGTYKDNDVITYEEDTNVTQVVLVVDKGTSIDTTIKPMLQLVSLEYPVLPMTKYKGNLFDVSKISKNTALMSADGKTGTSSVSNISDYIEVEANKKYILSFNYGSLANGSNRAICYYDTNKTFLSGGDYYPPNKEATITPTTDGYIRFCYDMNCYDIQVEEDSKTPYKAYNGKDGWYYVDGVSTQETRSGKNKAFISSIAPYNYKATLENGIITMNGTSASAGNLTIYLNDKTNLILKANTTYTFSIIVDGTITGSGYKVIYLKGNNVGSLVSNKTITFQYTPTEDTVVAGITFDLSANLTFNCTIKIQVEEGTVATEYEEYGAMPSPDYPSEIINIYKAGTYNIVANAKVYEFTLPEDLRGLPNGIGDRLWFDIDGDNGIDIERKVGKVVLNGSESWTQRATGIGSFHFNINNCKAVWGVQSSYCSYFAHNVDNAWNGVNGFGIDGNGRLMIGIDNITTLADFKTWLSTHNTGVQYELATYTISHIGQYSYSGGYEYEEYKNNTTLIDLAGNEFTTSDKITIKDNQIVLVKGKQEIFLGDVVMPRTYTPYTHAYSHQRVFIDFKYKDPRNIDITKINLKGLILTTDVETEYNFCTEDLTKVQNYIMGTDDLTNEELDVYDINGDGVITSYDYILIKGMIEGSISNKVDGTLEINSTQSKRTIVLKDKDGKILTSLGMNGISTPSLSVNGVLVEENIRTEETPTTQLLNGKRVYKRIFTGTMPTTSGANSSLANLDFEFDEAWIDQSLSYLTKDTETIPTTFYYSSGDYLRTWVNKDDASGTPHIRIRTGRDYSEYKYNIVVAYTKDDGSEPEEPEEPTQEIIEVNKASTITGSTSSSNWTFKTVATEEKVDTVNKTSTVTITNYIGRPSTNSSSYFMGTLTNNYKCGDQTYSETVYKNSGTINAGGWYKLGSRTFTIKHTTEPMKINVGGSMSTSAFNPNSASANGSITLTEI